tara:strand:+ start:4179 stop:5198 length:1020 start_codon:yes stop_codon:yes gene_type:complete
MNRDSFNFYLPKNQIAQEGKNIRSDSKLLVINRKTDELTDERFSNLDKFISKEDLIVVNDTKVIPARLFGNRKNTEGKVEIFVERILSENSFICQLKSTRKLYTGDKIIISKNIELEIENNNGILSNAIVKNITVRELLNKYGEIPLPPYIMRKPNKQDENYYQTIFAKNDGSVAAPTAALHFDERIIKKIYNKGAKITSITLHIGMGTFSSIKSKNIDEHKMHSELFCVPSETYDLIKQCKRNKGRIICVGTTVARALESFYLKKYKLDKFYETDIFIKPGYKFKIVDSLITNFHLPQSSLIIMIAAFYSTEKVLDAYKYAVKKNYKFFSYGDSTLIL